VEYRIDFDQVPDPGVVVVTLAGIADRAGFEGYMAELGQDRRMARVTGVIVDTRKLGISPMSTLDVRDLAERQAGVKGVRVAIVAERMLAVSLALRFVSFGEGQRPTRTVVSSMDEALEFVRG